MNLHYVIANRLLGLLCGVLTGRFYADLGPLRLIERALFRRLQLREWTFGWTIEAQIRATLLGARVVEVPVRYRSRIAGVQKVSHVSTLQTIRVGLKIVAAALRTRARAPRDLAESCALPMTDRFSRARGPAVPSFNVDFDVGCWMFKEIASEDEFE
jgi:hypothetical protein